MALVPTLKRMFIPLFFDSHRHPQFAIRFCVFRLFLIAFQRIVFCVESQRARERIRITIWSMSVLKHSKRWLLTCYACWIVTTFTRVHNTHTHTHCIARTIVFSFSFSSFFFIIFSFVWWCNFSTMPPNTQFSRFSLVFFFPSLFASNQNDSQ